MPEQLTREPGGPIAIVGIGCLFPGCENPDQLWEHIQSSTCTTTDVPPGRWLIEPSGALDPKIALADHVYSTNGGFVTVPRLDTAELDVDAEVLERLDPLFQLVLQVATGAWRDAQTEAVDRARVGVVLGNIVLPTETASALSREHFGRLFEDGLGIPASAASETHPWNAFPAGLPAALAARALRLGGVAYTLDAACGSSLYALKLAVDELESGRAVAMICGGVSRPDPLYTQMGFSQLRALSARGKPAPFDADADGLVVGEGAGMFVLKRLADALDHGDHIYGVVAGIGLSNDVHGDLLAPSAEGQLRAMRQAYKQAGWSPSDVDLIECHATGTPRGDAVELESLGEVWRVDPGRRKKACVIGSVKSNIGHTLTAAGSAGLLKVLLALRHRTLPPSANFERPHSNLELDESPFRILKSPEPWPSRASGRSRRAAVSGFGFGGINAHVLIEEWVPGTPLGSPGSALRRDRVYVGQPFQADVGLESLTYETKTRSTLCEDQVAVGQPFSRRAGNVRLESLTYETRKSGAPKKNRAPIAIVGMAAQFGPISEGSSLQDHILAERPSVEPSNPSNWWGIPSTRWYRQAGWDEQAFPGYYLDSLQFRLDQFRIPPKELVEILPQQSLMLDVAARALGEANWHPALAARTGVLIGIGLDLNTTNYHWRWSVPQLARAWSKALGLNLSSEEIARWIDDLRAICEPALSANRTIGSLGGVVASRIAREFQIGGPSFSISCDENSGVQALAIAVDWLRRNELDAAVVGAVDFAGDVRAVLARTQLGRDDRTAAVGEDLPNANDETITPVASDGAVCLILKRLDDARREGDRIEAVIREVTTRSERFAAMRSPSASAQTAPPGQDRTSDAMEEPPIGYLDIQSPNRSAQANGLSQILSDSAIALERDREGACAVGSILDDLGHIGAATGLAAVAKVALCLRQQIIPAPRGSSHWLRSFIKQTPPLFVPSGRQFWLRNRTDGPRRAAVCVESLGGALGEVVLEEFEPRNVAEHSIEKLARCARETSCRDIAFVYPGLGTHFAGMGRELATIWPDVLREFDAENGSLRDQFNPALWWGRELPSAFDDHRVPILASVWIGSLVTEILRRTGVNPRAAIGYSMGESTALISLRAWSDRDLLFARIRSSSLFQSELAGPCEAARRCWELDVSEPVDWVAGVVSCSAEAVETVICPGRRVYVLARNSAEETVIGGQRRAVAGVVANLRSSFVALPHVSTVHCEIGGMVEADYRALHDLEVNAPAGIDFYSGVWGRSYPVDRRTAADAITAQATQPIDFPAVIERAYQDGVRIFLEVGPGSSCTRLIDRILGDRPHLALSACRADSEPYHTILEVLKTLTECGVEVDLGRLNESARIRAKDEASMIPAASDAHQRTVRVDVRGRAFAVPQPSRVDDSIPPAAGTPFEFGHLPPLAKTGPGGVVPARPHPSIAAETGPLTPSPSPPRPSGERSPQDVGGEGDRERARRQSPLICPSDIYSPRGEGADQRANVDLLQTDSAWSRHLHQAAHATAEAHRAFLRTSQQTADLMGKLVAFQFGLLRSDNVQALASVPVLRPESQAPATDERLPEVASPLGAQPEPARYLLGRGQCLEFAVGSIAAVLGPDYVPIDQFPTRVRLPDEPLMLVDRILTVEGEPRSLQAGRIVTEHVVKPDAWYLDGTKVPACIAIEAGQADLFLSAYLGADFATEGRAVYRLLDATVTFHRELPRAGDVIRYDIRIVRFFRQGATILFHFQFDATIDGEPLLSMRDGCAGFFSAEELAAGKGIVAQQRRLGERLASIPQGLSDLISIAPTQLDLGQVDALRAGDLFAAFSTPFDRIAALDLNRLPGGRMALLHRVSLLDPRGGSRGLGLIRAEAGIRPGDWFLVCHFVDDRVMPGTLMYEGCLQALRILLLSIGWVGSRDQVAFEPATGVPNRLRCRGQVVESTRVVTYEVEIKDLRYQPQPVAVADAIIFADGKAIVEVRDMALQLSGADRHGLEQIWAVPRAREIPETAGRNPAGGELAGGASHSPALFDHDRILEFAVRKPSAAFGDRYRAFDSGRFIARLPAPPFLFIDRITKIDAEAWVMAAGSAATAEYDIPAGAWYFAADRQESVAHSVLLEAALQACGWLAAYMGSALHSDDDLKFRILGGSALKHRDVTRRTATLSTRVKATKISKTAGMILQQYEYSVCSGDGVVYEGIADLGFFHPRSLEDPDGIREFARSEAAVCCDEDAPVRTFAYPTEAPFPDTRWRMVDEIHELPHEGGPHGLGVVRGSARIDPDSWLFKAHFLGDPVWPGSLGQEALLQLLKFAAAERWGATAFSRFESPSLAVAHRWNYRGQITPENRLITIQAEIKQRDDNRRWLLADGNLEVDGRVIYQMRDYSLRLSEL
jgi:acyl transferase domain-containing protein/3-hydroxymyristoyl/3-hydroxydecanoyl-(acyl carrier protein) dehydratase